MPTNMQTWAQRYALRWYCVCPVLDKAPKHAGGRGWADASRHLPEVEFLFRTRRHTGIGVATGAGSGCWVLDEDGDLGRASLQTLIDRHGPLPHGPVTVTGNGRHFWYSWTDDCQQLRNRVGFAPGLDVRTNGGGVVVPPSLHRESGRRYAWEGPSLLDMAPPAAPEWLIDTIVRSYPVKQAEQLPQSQPAQKAERDSKEILDIDRYVERALLSAERKIETAQNGMQRATLNGEAASIGRRFVAHNLYKKADAIERLIKAGLKMKNHRKDQWTRASVEAVVISGMEYGIGRATDAA